MLPAIGGLDLCRILRYDSCIPLIMLTAKSTEADILTGLDLGADDYVTKPFSLKQLVARVRAVLRRVHAVEASGRAIIRSGHIEIDTLRHEASLAGEGAAPDAARIQAVGDPGPHARARLYARRAAGARLWL